MKIEQIFQRNNSSSDNEEDKDDQAFRLAKIMLHEVMNHTMPSEKTMDLIEGLTKNIDRLVAVTEDYIKETNEFIQAMKEKQGL